MISRLSASFCDASDGLSAGCLSMTLRSVGCNANLPYLWYLPLQTLETVPARATRVPGVMSGW